ncbi:MAG: hypothetical protein AB8B91_18515 [Rubripirellula sp.]
MSSDPLTYDPQAPDPGRQPSGANWSPLVVAMVCATLLLMCGGAIGLGVYAVDRLAKNLETLTAELDGEFEDSDSESPIALEFALQDAPVLRERVGTVKEIKFDSELSYDDRVSPEDYFFTVEGTTGDAKLVVQYSEDEQIWFTNIQLLEDDRFDGPRTELQSIDVPFDSQMSKLALTAIRDLKSRGEAGDAIGGLGPIRWIRYDYDRSMSESGGGWNQELYYTATDGSVSVDFKAEFVTGKYTQIRKIIVIDDQGESTEEMVITASAP